MTYQWTATRVSEDSLCRVAERVALKISQGDLITLTGDLGAGKSTFARALIRALLDDEAADVPSPTFSLVQTYDTSRLRLAHLDLYRLQGAADLQELGIDELLSTGAVVVEWPERAPDLASHAMLDVRFEESDGGLTRTLTLTGSGTWRDRLHRLAHMSAFIASSPPWPEAHARYLQGDASTRAYARLSRDGARAILMDSPRQPDGPPIRDGLPYSRIAHLAEDVRAFVAVARALGEAGFSVPRIYAGDLGNGFLLTEDFGDRVFGACVASGQSQAGLWQAATDTLLALRQTQVPAAIPLPDGTVYAVPAQDQGALEIEIELVADWYWPFIKGTPMPAAERQRFLAIWRELFPVLAHDRTGWVLRDYHSPNLMWLADRAGVRRTGIIDFQDALVGPAAYDLVSLLQDARLDVAADLEVSLFEHYCRCVAFREPHFDGDAFRLAYAVLGAQRNTKILGIFARLAQRDRKPAYLAHIPRIWRYMERNLAHPGLAGLRAWFDQHFPPETRTMIRQSS